MSFRSRLHALAAAALLAAFATARAVVEVSRFIQPKVDGKDPEGGVAAALIRDIVKQMNEDVPIWENKKYLPRPTLCDGDGPIAEFRRWCEQFYPASPS